MSSSYIGRSVDAINNISSLDVLSFNGSDATFNLTQNSVAFVPVSADALQIQIDGVIQSGNYTVSGSTVTFDFVPSGSSVCNGIRHYGVGLLTTVSDSSITTAKLGADSVNGSKIADDSISDEHLDITAITGQTAITSLADTDKFLVSDASDSGNLKYVEKQYLPSGTHVLIDEETTTSASTLTVTGMDSTYKTYMMDVIDMNSSQDADLRMRYVTSSGALTTSHYQYAGTGYNTSIGGSNWANNGLDYIKLLGETIRHDSGMSASLRLFISNPSGTSNQKRCFWMGGAQRTGDYTFSSQGSSNYFASTPAVTGLQVYLSSGNYDNVTIKLYGVK
jgi:hypothetical protein